MVLNRSRFLSAHCARIISRIIWLDTGPIQLFRTLAVSIFCVSVLRCLILQSPSFFTLHGSEQVKISVRALCAHNLAHNMAGHGPHSATVKLSKGAHVQPMAPWQPLLIRNMEINAQSIMRGLLGNGTMLQNIMRGLCAPGFLLCATLCATLCAGRIYYARYYARRLQHCNTLCADYARLCFIMRGIMRNIMRTAHIMREMLILHSALPGCLRRLPYACPTTPPLSTHIMARLSQPMLQTSATKVKLRRA